MELSAFVFKSELQQQKQAYIWFNVRPARAEALRDVIVEVVQGKHQQATEKKLLKALKDKYPHAKIEDDKGYRYIKTA